MGIRWTVGVLCISAWFSRQSLSECFSWDEKSGTRFMWLFCYGFVVHNLFNKMSNRWIGTIRHSFSVYPNLLHTCVQNLAQKLILQDKRWIYLKGKVKQEVEDKCVTLIGLVQFWNAYLTRFLSSQMGSYSLATDTSLIVRVLQIYSCYAIHF